MIKIFGHLSPDTDTVCSAILWAWHLNNSGADKATPYVLGTLNKETSFVLQKFNVAEPAILETLNAGDDVVIVDTNNAEELPPSLNRANIVQIIDHHKLSGGISTKKPIEVYIKPLASTATVMQDLMQIAPESLPKDMAGLLLSCILSDTLAFRSPTTTPHDRDLAESLGKSLGIDILKYAMEMFEKKSDVSDFTDLGLVHLDSKKVSLGNKSVRVSMVETVDPQSILKRKDGIIAAINEVIASESGTDCVLFFIVDILKEEATVLIYNDTVRKIIEESFNVKAETDMEVLPGIISRKKQIIPVLKLPESMADNKK